MGDGTDAAVEFGFAHALRVFAIHHHNVQPGARQRHAEAKPHQAAPGNCQIGCNLPVRCHPPKLRLGLFAFFIIGNSIAQAAERHKGYDV